MESQEPQGLRRIRTQKSLGEEMVDRRHKRWLQRFFVAVSTLSLFGVLWVRMFYPEVNGRNVMLVSVIFLCLALAYNPGRS